MGSTLEGKNLLLGANSFLKELTYTEKGSKNRVTCPESILITIMLFIRGSSAVAAGLPRSGKNIWKRKFFLHREKSGNFVDRQGNFKGLGKSGNLKINSYGRQTSENLFILFKRGKDVLSHEIV